MGTVYIEGNYLNCTDSYFEGNVASHGGSGIYVEGKLRYRDYEDKDGVRKYVTEIVADRIEFFNFGRRPEGAGQNAQNATQAAAASAQPTQDVVAEGSTDDLPF